MDVIVRVRNFELQPQSKEYIKKKLGRVGRHLPSAIKSSAELTSQNARSQQDRVTAQFTLEVNGVVLRGEERGATVMAAVDAAADVLFRRIDRFKGKTYHTERARRAVRRGEDREAAAESEVAALSEGPPVDEEASEVVVKNKTYPVKPMDIEEAIFQMELLGHGFFLFMNSEEANYNVLYRRLDGTYGIIHPEPL